MSIETNRDMEVAVARLARRTAESLATFIASLAHDAGPIGEHVRTFVVGDELSETITSLEDRIDGLRQVRHRGFLPGGDYDVGKRFNYILDDIEALVLPMAPRQAFRLLVLLIERDGDAMERCGDDHDTVTTAVERAAGLVVQTAPSLPGHEGILILQRLAADDGYGTRRSLSSLVQSQ